MDDEGPKRRDDAASSLAKEDIDVLSQHELDARIALLKTEIVRCEARKQVAGVHRASADALFRK